MPAEPECSMAKILQHQRRGRYSARASDCTSGTAFAGHSRRRPEAALGRGRKSTGAPHGTSEKPPGLGLRRRSLRSRRFRIATSAPPAPQYVRNLPCQSGDSTTFRHRSPRRCRANSRFMISFSVQFFEDAPCPRPVRRTGRENRPHAISLFCPQTVRSLPPLTPLPSAK